MTTPQDKPTLREQLDAVRPDSEDLRDVDLADAARALDNSAEWRDVFERQQEFDRQVAAAMQDVDLPEGLPSRLLETLAADLETSVAVPPAESSWHEQFRHHWKLAVLAAGLLLAVTVGWSIWSGDRTQITLEAARHSLPTTDDGTIDTRALKPFDESFAIDELPDTAWSRQTQMVAELKGLDWTGDARHDAAIYEFRINGRLHGYLVILPASILSDPPDLTRLSLTGIDYHPVPNTAWVDPDAGLAYICFVDQGDLSTLQRLLYPHAA